MRRLVVLQHAPHEGPSRVQSAFERAGFTTEILRLDLGTRVPETPAGMDALLVLGGSMGVGDLGDPRYPFLGPEIALLERAIASDFPTLGICLGSQLLACAAGARVYPNQRGNALVREVGWGAVHFTRSADEEPVLAGLDAAEMMLHWHGDTFDLPQDATLLASTLHCPNQMIRIKTRLFGVQFHPEVSEADIVEWIREDADYVAGALGPDGAARIAAETKRYIRGFTERGDHLLDNLVRAMTG
ncbi:MAG TPA: type 1 glutamine amidotransferase [Polyangiaceae bacterium]|nr:type 1 glutamine amidotransferase [Polyangiaceae bacterium]